MPRHVSLESGAEDQSPAVEAQGSHPVPRVRWPRLPSLPRASVLPAIALFACMVALLIAGSIVVCNRLPRRTTATEPPTALTGSARTEHRPASEPYRAAIRGHERELRRCAREHSDGFPLDAEAVIIVGVDGLARQVVIQPDRVEHSALGSCIRGVLKAVRYPTAAEDEEVAIGLAVYR